MMKRAKAQIHIKSGVRLSPYITESLHNEPIVLKGTPLQPNTQLQQNKLHGAQVKGRAFSTALGSPRVGMRLK